MALGAVQTDEAPIPLEERQALVDRIAGSNELRRSARLRAFLLYVWGRVAADQAVVIHEQEIGSAVFGRPEYYDTAVDNIVRVNATELRKRLERYFAEEGANEELILEIQRGSYVPCFRRRTVAARPGEPAPARALPEPAPAVFADAPAADPPAIAEAPPESAAVPVVTAARGAWIWKAACLVLLLCSAGLFWWAHTLSTELEPWKADPALKMFWSQFFDSGTPTDVVLADTSLSVAEDMMQRSVPLTDYLNYNYKRMGESLPPNDPRRQDLQQVLNRNNGSNADFRVSQQILALSGGPDRFNLRFSRDYTPEAAKNHNIILIGAHQSNPWVNLFTARLNFDLDYDPVQRIPVITNRSPQAGEQANYPVPLNRPESVTGYAVIAFIPDVTGKSKVLILEGTDSQATGAAGDFVTSADSLAALEQKFPAGKVPYFEVLLRTSQLSGTSLHGDVIATRIYK